VSTKENQDTRGQASLALATFITPENNLMDKGIMESLSGQVIDFEFNPLLSEDLKTCKDATNDLVPSD